MRKAELIGELLEQLHIPRETIIRGEYLTLVS